MNRGKPLRRTGFAPTARRPILRTEAPKARQRPLKAQSDRRRAEAPERAEVRRITEERAGHRCQAIDLWPHACRGPLDTNEIVMRSGRPGGHLDPSNTNLLCRYAHEWVTGHPTEAVALGLRRWSWQDRGMASPGPLSMEGD